MIILIIIVIVTIRSKRTDIFVTQFGRLNFDKELCNRYGENMLFLTPTYFRCISPENFHGSDVWQTNTSIFLTIFLFAFAM